mmetsp:Transcript_6956/g.15263  ORF Transcript_6956/g.15263 Transcript_6956/m.15263 type:complete len:349 (-) Transcript_6956:902-1948(-)
MSAKKAASCSAVSLRKAVCTSHTGSGGMFAAAAAALSLVCAATTSANGTPLVESAFSADAAAACNCACASASVVLSVVLSVMASVVARAEAAARAAWTACNRALNRAHLAGRFGVPTKSCKSNLPGRVTAASSAVSRFVAIKNATCRRPRRSASLVSMAVVSMRDSIPRLGLSRSRQNSSTSSNRTTTCLSCISIAKISEMREATFDSPELRNIEVSMATNPQPSLVANASTTVVFAVPGGPKRMAEYDAAASSAVNDDALAPLRPRGSAAASAARGESMRCSSTCLIVTALCAESEKTSTSLKSESSRRSHDVGSGGVAVLPPSSLSTSLLINELVSSLTRERQRSA